MLLRMVASDGTDSDFLRELKEYTELFVGSYQAVATADEVWGILTALQRFANERTDLIDVRLTVLTGLHVIFP